MPILPPPVAPSYTPRMAINMARRMAHGIPVDALSAQVADIINSGIWNFWPWVWSQLPLTPISLVNGQQDYSGVPTDFQRWVSARIAQTNLTPVEYRELSVQQFLPVELTMQGGIDSIRNIFWEPVANVFRLNYAAIIGTGTTIEIQGEYQPRPTRIVEYTLDTPYLNPDAYFMVHVEGIKYWFYQLSDDPRVGSVAVDRRGNKQYTGQLGIFRDSLLTMASAEDANDGTLFTWPNTSLGAPRMGVPGFGGY